MSSVAHTKHKALSRCVSLQEVYSQVAAHAHFSICSVSDHSRTDAFSHIDIMHLSISVSNPKRLSVAGAGDGPSSQGTPAGRGLSVSILGVIIVSVMFDISVKEMQHLLVVSLMPLYLYLCKLAVDEPAFREKFGTATEMLVIGFWYLEGIYFLYRFASNNHARQLLAVLLISPHLYLYKFVFDNPTWRFGIMTGLLVIGLWFLRGIHYLCRLATNSAMMRSAFNTTTANFRALGLQLHNIFRAGAQSALKAYTWAIELAHRCAVRVLDWSKCFFDQSNPHPHDELPILRPAVAILRDASVAGGGVHAVLFLAWLVFWQSLHNVPFHERLDQRLQFSKWVDAWIWILTGGAMLATVAFAWIRHK